MQRYCPHPPDQLPNHQPQTHEGSVRYGEGPHVREASDGRSDKWLPLFRGNPTHSCTVETHNRGTRVVPKNWCSFLSLIPCPRGTEAISGALYVQWDAMRNRKNERHSTPEQTMYGCPPNTWHAPVQYKRMMERRGETQPPLGFVLP